MDKYGHASSGSIFNHFNQWKIFLKKHLFYMALIATISGCTPEGIFDLGYGIRGGVHNTGMDFALGSNVSEYRANKEYKDCSDKYMGNGGSLLVEQCMYDKGYRRLSRIKNGYFNRPI